MTTSPSPPPLSRGVEPSVAYSPTPKNAAERDVKIRVLYEEYIKLHPCLNTWNSPITSKPKLEPIFNAGWHGIELAFIMMSQFISDTRNYVVKRPRIELIAADIMSQMNLMAEIIDGELEDEATSLTPEALNLTQCFPFPSAPPTASTESLHPARQSPALEMLIDSISVNYPALTGPEQNSLRKVIRNITGTFQSCFSEWSVGVGIEEQLSQIRQLASLPPMLTTYNKQYLDYTAMVRPHVIAETFTDHTYDHNEDFFFRSVHLGTECWAYVALKRLESAKLQLSLFSHWHNAAAHITSASHILSYLGDHIMMLTSMVLRDYLYLKVEIEGTSGEGSSAVKQLRPMIVSLLEPFMETLSSHWGSLLDPALKEDETAYQRRLLLHLYSNPEKQPGLYSYAKALESIESGLLGGFYFKHYCLASNVIGTQAKGTMNKAVKMLKVSYEKAVFPNLDAVRSDLGAQIDAKLSHNKAKIMNGIEQEYLDKERIRRDSEEGKEETFFDAAESGGCPFGFSKGKEVVVETGTGHAAAVATLPPSPPGSPTKNSSFDAIRRSLYSSTRVPPIFASAALSELADKASHIAFLDHAWGKTPPNAGVAAAKRQYGLYQKGNAAWDTIFGDIMPEAIEHIRYLLSPPVGASVEFGHNSHELISRLISIKMEKLFKVEEEHSVLRILTTDTEFYSFTRQMNRLLKIGSERISIEFVAIEPLASFPDRFAEKVAASPKLDIVYVSHCVFSTQQTIIPDLPSFAEKVSKQLHSDGNGECFFIVDGYHGFGAIPTDLSGFDDVFYVSGMLKHVGSGANCCFLVVPECKIGALNPVFTGWIADPSVLAAESKGIQMGSDVGYVPGFSLQGGTPAFAPSLIIFNEVMRRWKEKNITVDLAHGHVIGLHRQFLLGIEGIVGKEGAGCCWSKTAELVAEGCRSHTITFLVKSPAVAKCIVQLMDNFGVAVDSRKFYVRFGFGFNHNSEDVVELLSACEKVATMIDAATEANKQ